MIPISGLLEVDPVQQCPWDCLLRTLYQVFFQNYFGFRTFLVAMHPVKLLLIAEVSMGET